MNNKLLQAPDQTKSLLGILLRFREEDMAVMAGIESMFYQIEVPKEEHNFPWWRDGDFDRKPKEYRMGVHLYRALHQIALENTLQYPTASNAVLKHFYVDDILSY